MWNKATDSEESFRDKAIWWSAGIVIAAAIALGVYYRYYSPTPAPPAQHPAAAPQPAAAPAPAIQHPIPSAAEQQQAPLPPLDQSDPVVRDSLIGLLGKPAVAKFLVPHQVIRDVVVTVDNLPRKKVAAELRPLQPTPGDTAVDTQGGSTALSPQNYARYTALMDVVRSTDPKALAAIYLRLYPLFQQAYENLGYPGKYFNDRMVQAIDSLLATPDVQGPIELVRPKVFYQFADPRLEALPAGQKLLIRMGPQNASLIKSKLQEFRTAITAQPPQMTQPAQATPPPQPAAPPPQGNSGAQTNPLPPGTQATPSNPPPAQQQQQQAPPPL
ncbi:MAG TPA: DUF3014 domain-containing protein [Steroidobacteraceae bacterium]|jgi:hypothetical protein|nr:DUF3014 domain-containing protein [Steroidobacteraceae bacterium]